MMTSTFVIPAKAGIHRASARPAPTMDSRFRGNDKPGEIRAIWLGY